MKQTDGPWIKLRLDMLESPAWAALSAPAKKVIERLMIEHMKHAGKDNGRLVCTYDDLEQFHIGRKRIAPAIRLLANVGFVEITDRGWKAAAHGRPAKYRLTFLPAGRKPPTDEWARWAPGQQTAPPKVVKLHRYRM